MNGKNISRSVDIQMKKNPKMDKNEDCISLQPNTKTKNEINYKLDKLSQYFKDPKSPINKSLQSNYQNDNYIWNGLYTLTKLIGFPLEHFKDVCSGKMKFAEGFTG